MSKLTTILAGAAFLAGTGLPALAQDYPVDTVTLITHSSPGGGSDVFLREAAKYLSPILGATIVVENVTGGSGAKAMADIANAKPDGSRFYATTPTFIYTSLLSKPDYSYQDMEPLVNVFSDPEVIFTATESPYKTLGDAIQHAKDGRGKWGAANPASLERMALEQLKTAAGVNAAIVTFEGGGDMQINVLNGTLDFGVGEVQELKSQLDAGKVRILGVLTDDRLPAFPDVPTVKEAGWDVSVHKFRGLAGPKGEPEAVVKAWEAAIPKLLDDPEYKKVYEANSLKPEFIGHDDYVTFMNKFADDTKAFLTQTGVIK